MDQIELKVLETDVKSNKYYTLVKKVTLHFLLPVSLVFLPLLYSGFSFFNSYNYNSSTFIFPLLTHVFERKYMFLLCNGILAFLAKNMSFSSSSSYDVSDTNGKILEGSDSDGKIKETTNRRASQHDELKREDEQGEQEVEEDKEMMYSYTAENEGGDASISEDNGHEDEESIGEGWGGLIGESPAEEEIDDMNTEELNKKIEAFIRKMKEEIRIEAHQQLITV